MTHHKLHILRDDEQVTLDVPDGSNLRRVLLDAGYSPYTSLTRHLNCGGRGICATCGVRILEGEPPPQHWHDRIGASFGYPRLSCQITVDREMTVRIMTEKWIWGQRDPSQRWESGD